MTSGNSGEHEQFALSGEDNLVRGLINGKTKIVSATNGGGLEGGSAEVTADDR